MYLRYYKNCAKLIAFQKKVVDKNKISVIFYYEYYLLMYG